MESKDWAELWQLNEQAKVALMMGQLDQMQMADAMAFHTLSHFILDLNDRLGKLETTPNKPVVTTPILWRAEDHSGN